MNVVELAKSGRSSCRTCKEKIEKNAPRLGIESEFSRDGRVYKSMKWHHITCAAKELAEEISSASISKDLDEEQQQIIAEIKKKANKSGFAVISISELAEPSKNVNIQAVVKRKLRIRDAELKDKTLQVSTTYVEEGDQRRKFLLWDKHAHISVDAGDVLIILSGVSEFGSDDKIQVNAYPNSIVLVNPSDADLLSYTSSNPVFQSKKWDRPNGQKCQFEYAKSGRASCFHCKEKISKGELKIIQAIWMENDTTKNKFPGHNSFHVEHVLDAEHGLDIFHEALTRMTPDLIGENKIIFRNLLDKIKDENVKTILLDMLDLVS